MIKKKFDDFWWVNIYRFPEDDMAVLEDNGDACLMKCGFHSEYTEDCIDCGMDYLHILFLLIGDDIVVLEVDIYYEKAWLINCLIPKNLETRKEDIKCMANDMMMELLVGQENEYGGLGHKKLTSNDVQIVYNRFKGCTIYDKEI